MIWIRSSPRARSWAFICTCYTGGEPLVRKADLILKLAEKHNDVQFAYLYQLHPDR